MKTDNTGTSNNDQITLPITEASNFIVNWGDGSSEPYTGSTALTHTYPTAGTYTIKIHGTVNGWKFANSGDKLKLTNISQFGRLNITTDQAFYGCANMTITATDVLDIYSPSLDNMFRKCSSIITIPSVNNW